MDHRNSRHGNGTRTKADFVFCKSEFTYLLTQNGKRSPAEKCSVTRWKLRSLFCRFISVPQPWIRGPIAMETIMWGNWRRSTLEISLEYISSCKSPHSPHLQPLAIVSELVYFRRRSQDFRPWLRNVRPIARLHARA